MAALAKTHPEPPVSEKKPLPVVTITGMNEYGPLLTWAKHWTEFPIGTVLCVKERDHA